MYLFLISVAAMNFVISQESLLTQRTRTRPEAGMLLLLMKLRNKNFEMMTY